MVKKKRKQIEQTILHFVLVTGSIVFAFPFFWLVLTSIKADREIFVYPPKWIPQMPYRVKTSPYIAQKEYPAFSKPKSIPDEEWKNLHDEVRIAIWEECEKEIAAIPQLQAATEESGLYKEFRDEMIAGIWKQIADQSGNDFWATPKPQLLKAIRDFVSPEKVSSIGELIYREIGIGDVLIQNTHREETAVNGSINTWKAESDNVLGWQTYAAAINYAGLRHDLRSRRTTILSNTVELPFGLENVRAITLPIKGDELYHQISLKLETVGGVYYAKAPFVVDTYLWKDAIWQLKGVPDENERNHLLLIADPNQRSSIQNPEHIHLTLTIKRPSYLWVLYRKFIRNYVEAAEYVPFWKFIWNTVNVTLKNIIAQLFACSFVAYSFARLKWPGRDICFIILLSTMMLPSQVTMIPVFLIMQKLHLYNTLEPLWVPSLFGSAFFIFLMRQFFMTLPKELEDAAKIDGCGYFGIYWRIMLPLVKPAMAAIAIFQFMNSWNDFMGPLIYVNSEEITTISLGLFQFTSQHSSEFGMLMAAASMMILPVIAIFFLAQRHFIEGVTLTGMKG
ncbi:ABC transporter permease subunit [Candidatus Poribacteria bacterium]|nr:ABC transporter permease subunit [Candidatus Poribacteria bacterium]